jgi:rhodanese-related sulfurtransferase
VAVVAVLLIFLAVATVPITIWVRRKRDRQQLAERTITPDELHAALQSKKDLVVLDVRLPLDLLADSEIIPGAARVDPREVLQNPAIIPQDRDAVVYCTCPGDKTSASILRLAKTLHIDRVKLLRGGLAAWKAKGYPVEAYDKSFHLDTRT